MLLLLFVIGAPGWGVQGLTNSMGSVFKELYTDQLNRCPADLLFTKVHSYSKHQCAMICSHSESCRRFQFNAIFGLCHLYQIFYSYPFVYFLIPGCQVFERGLGFILKYILKNSSLEFVIVFIILLSYFIIFELGRKYIFYNYY